MAPNLYVKADQNQWDGRLWHPLVSDKSMKWTERSCQFSHSIFTFQTINMSSIYLSYFSSVAASMEQKRISTSLLSIGIPIRILCFLIVMYLKKENMIHSILKKLNSIIWRLSVNLLVCFLQKFIESRSHRRKFQEGI